jgi:hypothetical protein
MMSYLATGCGYPALQARGHVCRIERIPNQPIGIPVKNTFALVLLSSALAASAGAAFGAPNDAKQAYSAIVDKANSDYKTDRARCNSLTGNPKDVCIAQAKATQVYTEANAKARYKNTLDATTDGRKAVAEADFDVEKAKCGSLTGNPRDVCIKEAKANLVAALADAKADRKVAEARTDAREDKRSADYKVAVEKCDAYAGDPKKACMADVKAQFGK